MILEAILKTTGLCHISEQLERGVK